MILRGKQLGFSIAEIQRLLQPLKNDMTADLDTQLSPEMIFSKLQSLEKRRNEVDRAINDLREKLGLMDQQKAAFTTPE
jgi:DNA-binding transcriptional MerR regulator